MYLRMRGATQAEVIVAPIPESLNAFFTALLYFELAGTLGFSRKQILFRSVMRGNAHSDALSRARQGEAWEC